MPYKSLFPHVFFNWTIQSKHLLQWLFIEYFRLLVQIEKFCKFCKVPQRKTSPSFHHCTPHIAPFNASQIKRVPFYPGTKYLQTYLHRCRAGASLSTQDHIIFYFVLDSADNNHFHDKFAIFSLLTFQSLTMFNILNARTFLWVT